MESINHTIEQFTINTDNKEDDNKEDDNKEDITSIQKTNNSTLKIHSLFQTNRTHFVFDLVFKQLLGN